MLRQLLGIQVEHVEELDWSLDAVGVSAIAARTPSGSISLQGTDQGQVIVHARKTVRAPTREKAEAFAREVQVHAERDNGQVQVYVEHPNLPGRYGVTVSYVISCPPGVNADLHTSSGGIKVEAIEGAVSAHTHSGGIKVLGPAGAADLHTNSGGIRAEGVVGPIVAKTSSGGIEVQGGSGTADLHTSSGGIRAKLGAVSEKAAFASSSGSIHVEIVESACPVTIKGSSGAISLSIGKGIVPITATTSSGSVEVTLPAGYAGQLDAHTNSGSVHCDLPLSASKVSRKHVLGKLGEGGEALVKLHTSSGSVRISAQ